MSDVEIIECAPCSEVLVRGRRVPFLSVNEADGGRIMLVFDRRLAVELDAANYEHITAFVADVIENCLHPEMGRTFNRVHEVTGFQGEDPS